MLVVDTNSPVLAQHLVIGSVRNLVIEKSNPKPDLSVDRDIKGQDQKERSRISLMDPDF